MGKTLKQYAKNKGIMTYADKKLIENSLDYIHYYTSLDRLINSMFVWEKMPNNISNRFLERTLCDDGFVIFYKSKKLGHYVISRATIKGVNDYDEPTLFEVQHKKSVLGIDIMGTETVKISDCVVIYNDITLMGETERINYYATKLAEIEKTITVNLKQLKNPCLISCPETQKESVRKMLEKTESGEPWIVTTDDFGEMVKVNVFDTHVQNHIESLEKEKTQIKNNFLTEVGINNVNIMKKERLVTSESNANNEEILFNKITRLMTRKKAIEEIKEKFPELADSGIDVNISTNFFDELAILNNSIERGVANNE